MSERDELVAVAMRCCAERKLSARINVETVAQIVGCTKEDVSVLMQANVLKPLGKPGQNAPKRFGSVEIMQLAADRKWLDDVTKTLSRSWRRKGARRSASADSENGPQQEDRKIRSQVSHETYIPWVGGE